MVYNVIFERDPVKFFKKNRPVEKEFKKAFDILALDPNRERREAQLLDIKELKRNWSGYYRLRIDNHRAIFDMQHEKITILVVEVRHRKNIYD